MRFSNPGDLIQVILESSGVLAPPFLNCLYLISFSAQGNYEQKVKPMCLTIDEQWNVTVHI